MNCANCNKSALFEYRVTHGKSIFYCNSHLPSFLEPRKKAGLLSLTSTYTEDKESALQAVKVQALEPEPVVEEQVKPKKKATKKKAE